MARKPETLRNDAYADALFARLPDGIAPWSRRSMFGGQCLVAITGMFCVVWHERVYLRVSDTTRAHFERAGMTPFQPGGAMMRGYYEVPPAVLDDGERLREWMETAALLPRPASKRPRPRARAA
ncbi:MAG TPA: TfoX/Sxy family protein [Solimonas sp.]